MGSTWLHLITAAVLLSCAFGDCDLTDDPPQIEIFPLRQTVTTGSTTVFVCTVTGNSKFRINWHRYGENIHYHPRNGSFNSSQLANAEHIPKFEKIDMTSGSALKIYSAERGTFECIVGNGTEELGRATAQLKTIDSPLKVDIFPRNQTIKAGGIAVFICMVPDSPNLQIKWIRNNGSEREDRSRYEMVYGPRDRNFRKFQLFETINMTSGSMIRIRALGPETFDCVAENGYDEPVRATAHLNSIPRYLPRGFPQIAPEENYTLRVTIGHRTLLPFLVTGDPKLTIRWLKNKLPLNMSIPRYSVFEEQFLQISDAKEEDEGEYECIANNSVGTALSIKIKLLVSESLLPPYFIIKPEELYKPLPGSSINITCLGHGSPQPSVKWIEDSTEVSPDRYGLNVLVLTDIQGSHNYTCVASSEMGDAEVTSRVVTKNLPIAPTNLQVSESSKQSRSYKRCADVSWSYDNRADIIKMYRIRYKKIGESYVAGQYSDPAKNRHDTVCDLSPNSEYEFYVTAENEDGEGPPSSSVSHTT